MTALVALIRAQRLATLAAVFAALSFVLPLGFSASGQPLHWPNVAGPFVFACCGLFTAAAIAAALVVLVGAIERRALAAMGAPPEARA